MFRPQRGWVGMLLILVALVVVAALAQTALKRYGLLGSDRARVAPPRQPGSTDAASGTASAPSLQAPIERGKGVEATVLQGAAEQNKRIEEQSR
jgi:hypothetical protein